MNKKYLLVITILTTTLLTAQASGLNTIKASNVMYENFICMDVTISFVAESNRSNKAVAVTDEVVVAPDSSANIQSLDKGQKQDKKPPLYVIDGKIISSEKIKMDTISIESIRVVKGKEATDLYGEKAVDGVIIITTKKKAKRTP